MKILFMTLSALTDFTQQHLVSDLPRYFAGQGHEVWILTQTEGDDAGLREEGGMRVLRVKVGTTEKVGALKKVFRLAALDRGARRLLARYAGDARFDCVVPIVSHLAFYRTVKKLTRRADPYVYMLLKDIFPYNTLDMGMLTKRGVKGVLYRFFARKERKYYALCDKIGCISPAAAEFVRAQCPYLDPGKVVENPNSIIPRERSFDREELDALRVRYGLPADRKILIYGGNLGKPQGVDFLLACMRATVRDDVHYLIVGAGTEADNLKKSIADGTLPAATFIPMQPQEEFHKLLRLSYAGLVFLSPKFTMPNYPSRTLAYLEESLPIVFAVDRACDAGIIAEANGYGYNLISGDTEAFLAAVDKLADDPKTARAMGARGRAYLEQHYHARTSYELILAAMAEKQK